MIEIGGGTKCPTGSTNLDPVHGEGFWKRMAQDAPWPASDGSIDGVRAWHVLEHIPAGQDRITVMNEAHRVLKPGGLFKILVPLFPSWQAVADPTHVSFWCRESFDYFTKGIANADYGVSYWALDSWKVVNGWAGYATLRK